MVVTNSGNKLALFVDNASYKYLGDFIITKTPPVTPSSRHNPGLGLGGEVLVGDSMGVTFQSGYDKVSDDGNGGSGSLISLYGGFKYYFSDNEKGLYGHAQLGLTIITVTYRRNYPDATTGLTHLWSDHESTTPLVLPRV